MNISNVIFDDEVGVYIYIYIYIYIVYALYNIIYVTSLSMCNNV